MNIEIQELMDYSIKNEESLRVYLENLFSNTDLLFGRVDTGKLTVKYNINIFFCTITELSLDFYFIINFSVEDGKLRFPLSKISDIHSKDGMLWLSSVYQTIMENEINILEVFSRR